MSAARADAPATASDARPGEDRNRPKRLREERIAHDPARSAHGSRGATGSSVAPEQAPPDPVQKALAYILRSTQSRPQTEAEMGAKLRAREIDGDVAEEAIRRAKRMRAIDDAAFARAWVEDRGRQRGFGAARLRQELRRRQVPDSLIAEALEQLDGRDEFTVAAQLARARLGQLPATLEPEAVARRLTAYLVRRGHPPGLSQRVAITVSGLDRRWD